MQGRGTRDADRRRAADVGVDARRAARTCRSTTTTRRRVPSTASSASRPSTSTTIARGRTNADDGTSPRGTQDRANRPRTTPSQSSSARRCGRAAGSARRPNRAPAASSRARSPTIAGSSEWFDRGFVTYSNEAKMTMLLVPPAMLAEHGAVSEPAARAMAEGALARSRAHVAVAVTGIAGPGGAVPGKPVGTVCFAWAARGRAHARRNPALSGRRSCCGAPRLGGRRAGGPDRAGPGVLIPGGSDRARIRPNGHWTERSFYGQWALNRGRNQIISTCQRRPRSSRRGLNSCPSRSHIQQETPWTTTRARRSPPRSHRSKSSSARARS